MKTELRPNEKLLKEGAANLQRGLEAVGGKLYLTDQRLVFESHAFNVQTGSTEIARTDIRAARPGWSKLLGLIPLAPNLLDVATANGEEYRFVVFGRKAWAEAIQEP